LHFWRRIRGMTENITSILHENRVFDPPERFRAEASVSGMDAYEALYKRSVDDPDAFWSEVASELHWFSPWTKVLEWKEPFAKWFVGGTTNLAYNCLDRHLSSWRRNKAAIVWEGEPGDERTLTYQQLHREVCRFANVLKGLGVRKGDRVALYMGLVPELAIAMLACARIGATHSVVFGGFSADALRDRVNDAEAKVIVAADGAFRRGTIVELKQAVDDAAAQCPSVTDVVVFRRTGHQIAMHAGRDHWWHELMEAASTRGGRRSSAAPRRSRRWSRSGRPGCCKRPRRGRSPPARRRCRSRRRSC
jgi:acetyl-CoA synthetase